MSSSIHSTHHVKGAMRYQERIGILNTDAHLMRTSQTGPDAKSWMHGSLKKDTIIKLGPHSFAFAGTGTLGSSPILSISQSGPSGHVSVNGLLQTPTLQTTYTNFTETGSSGISPQSLYVSDGSDGNAKGSLIFKSSDGTLYNLLIEHAEQSNDETKHSRELNSSYQIAHLEDLNYPQLIGPTGPTGKMGLIGKSGEMGCAGPEGKQGLIGPRGPPGITGLKGDRGEAGVQGPIGVQGEMGLMGQQGPMGIQGPMGDRGLPGIDGMKGERGLPGIMGPTGSTGNNGPIGAMGRRGSKGSRGDTGPIGPSVIGPTGAQGLRGFIGHTGSRGLMGNKGNIGHTGSQGPQGIMGSTGSAGEHGNTGPTGAQGIQGNIGPTGSSEITAKGNAHSDILFWDQGSKSFTVDDTQSVHLGSYAGLYSSLTGSVMIGYQAGVLSNDTNAVFIGYESGVKTVGHFDVGIGYHTLCAGSSTGVLPTDPTSFTGTFHSTLSSIAIGTQAGAAPYPGPSFRGDGKGNYYLNSGASFPVVAGNISIGAFAGINPSGPSNVAIGNGAAGGGSGFSIEEVINGETIIAFQTGPFVGGQQGLGIAIGTASAVISQGIGAVAIGTTAGFFSQGDGAVAVGMGAGAQEQGECAVAYGKEAGHEFQGASAVAIGNSAGLDNQGMYSVAIGDHAGNASQGANSIAIGPFAGADTQAAGSIVMNASLNSLNAPTTGLFINPIRQDSATNCGLAYNPSTSELTYSTSKTFVIQHPTQPDHLLVHACLEGPESGVFYRGESSIGKDGFADISLPSYADALATEWTVHITPIYSEDEVDCKIPRPTSVRNGKFRVYGKGAFYWLVIGKRASIVTELPSFSTNVRGEGPYKYII